MQKVVNVVIRCPLTEFQFCELLRPFSNQVEIEEFFMVVFTVYKHTLFTPKQECAILKMLGHATNYTWRPGVTQCSNISRDMLEYTHIPGVHYYTRLHQLT